MILPSNPSPTPPKGTLCLVCDKASKGYCYGCFDAPYCSTACQDSDVFSHRPLCRKILEWDDIFKWEDGQHRMLYFSPIKPHPSFQFNLFEKRRLGSSIQTPDIVPAHMDFFCGKSPTVMTFDCHRALQRQFDYTVVVMIGAGRDPDRHRDRDMNIVNRGVRRLVDRKSQAKWKGGMLVYGLKGTIKERMEKDEEEVKDIDTTCMPALLEFLKVKSGDMEADYKLG